MHQKQYLSKVLKIKHQIQNKINAMKSLRFLLLTGTLLFTSLLFSCQSLDPVPEHQTFTIQSKPLGERRTINVWTPPEYNVGKDSLMVLYMPDGGVEEDFPHVANTLDTLIKAKKIPATLLVGIENTQRRRDLTGPTTVKRDKKIAPVVGESEAFRNFIQDELIPEINKRYRTSAKKGIIGESLAGLFVTETFLLTPELFDFYIAFDPSVWWNNQYLVKNANSYLDKFPPALKTFWFAGSDATDISNTVRELSQILQQKNSPSIHWNYADESKETHKTIFRATKEKALIWTLNHLQ